MYGNKGLSGCGCGCSGGCGTKKSGMSGLGDLTTDPPAAGAGYTSTAITGSDIDMLMIRNPILAARVAAFTAIVEGVGYSQQPVPYGVSTDQPFWGSTLNYWLQQLPGWIPPWGLAVTDSVFGQVFVFPDASGALHFTASNAPAGDINNPIPQPKPGPGGCDPNASGLDQLLCGGEFLILLVAGYFAMQAYRTVKA